MGKHWRLSPPESNGRAALSGAVMGAAAALGYAVSGNGRFQPPTARADWAMPLPEAAVHRDTGPRRLGLRLSKPDCDVWFERDDLGNNVLRISSAVLTESTLAQRASELVGRICQQSAYHRLVIALRCAEFTIVERKDQAEAGASILGRLPVHHQPTGASRTAHPQFRISVDIAGQITVQTLRLPRESQLLLATLLQTLLGPASSIAEEAAYADRPSRSRSSARGHAA